VLRRAAVELLRLRTTKLSGHAQHLDVIARQCQHTLSMGDLLDLVRAEHHHLQLQTNAKLNEHDMGYCRCVIWF
jgi:hypothetical protein